MCTWKNVINVSVFVLMKSSCCTSLMLTSGFCDWHQQYEGVTSLVSLGIPGLKVCSIWDAGKAI